MGVTNEFERDVNDTAFLKRPGRVDLIVLQNIADCGDGHPGLQRAFRNYLHEGGMEKDLDLVGYSIKGTSVNINNAELQQLSNIGSAIINGIQWGYVGAMNQGVTETSNVAFGQITLSGNIIMTNNNITFTTGLVDGVDVGSHDHSGGDKGVAVPFTSLSGDIIYTQLDAIVDISGIGTASMISAAVHQHTNADGSSKVSHLNLTNIENNPHSVTLDQGFDKGKIIDGANSEANAFQVGNGTDILKLWGTNSNQWILGTTGRLNIKGNTEIAFITSGGNRWWMLNTGHLYPETGNTYDIGSSSFDVKYIYYCNMSDTSCADFSKMSADKLYNAFAQIKPRTDNIRHKTKDADFEHIDFSTLPDCFTTKADKDFIKENVWKKVDDKLVKTTIDYKKGDNCGIEMGNMVYALKDLMVKSYEKIKELEKQIQTLKSL